MDSMKKAERYKREEERLKRYRRIGEYVKSEQVGIREGLKAWRLMLVFSFLLKKPGLILLGTLIIILRHFGAGVRKFIVENFQPD